MAVKLSQSCLQVGRQSGRQSGLRRSLRSPVAKAALLALLAMEAAGTSGAQGQQLAPEEARRRLEAEQRQLENVQRRREAATADVEAIHLERARLNNQLVDQAQLIQRTEQRLSEIEARLAELEAQENVVRGSLAQRHGTISKLLAAMQRMGRNPPPVMITRREDALAMVRSAMLLAAVFPELREQAQELSRQLTELARVLTASRQEQESLKAETARLQEGRIRLDGLLVQKRLDLEQRQEEIARLQQAAESYARTVSDLNELIRKAEQAIAERTAMAAYERELAAATARALAEQKEAAQRQAQAAAQAQAVQAPSPQPQPLPQVEATKAPTAAPQPAPKVVAEAKAAPKPDGSKPDKSAAPAESSNTIGRAAIELAPSSNKLALASPGDAGRMTPKVPFPDMRGRLPLPVVGRKVIGWGDKTQFGGSSKGIVMETRARAQVTSPADGWVVYAGEFRSFGQIMIINGGGGYHVLLAGLAHIDAVAGQFVLAGEPVGTMGTATKPTQEKTQDTNPVLYIEIRKDGRPIDPEPWWASKDQKLQG